jgi:hypothetical protein
MPAVGRGVAARAAEDEDHEPASKVAYQGGKQQSRASVAAAADGDLDTESDDADKGVGDSAYTHAALLSPACALPGKLK